MEPRSASAGQMLSIGTHSLSLSLSGPVRSPPEPIVVIIPGAGDVAASYVALERLLRLFTQTLLYDRTGLGRSERRPAADPAQSSAVTAAEELHALLAAANITPPFLLVGHSYGGIVAREFLHLYPDLVAGMVLCDAATERSSDLLTFPDPNIVAVTGDLNYARVTGLREETVLSDEEWRVRAREIYASVVTAQAEAASFVEVCQTLKAKKQYENRALGQRPLSVIRANGVRDYERIYEKGIEAGNGSVEQRRAFRELLDRWEGIDRELQEEQLLLSTTTRLVRLEDCGHNVHLVRPDVLAEEIRWVRDRIADPLSRSSGLL
ncbi:alpha/beta fold hydrolase [Aspergillus lucknowensis]|uniref:Alpha/Beta hydrolase protein n=1 Tax=Aspergillus lucknowensis TaxID=176173 RepID=A0ABR4LBF4_9EURO